MKISKLIAGAGLALTVAAFSPAAFAQNNNGMDNSHGTYNGQTQNTNENDYGESAYSGRNGSENYSADENGNSEDNENADTSNYNEANENSGNDEQSSNASIPSNTVRVQNPIAAMNRLQNKLNEAAAHGVNVMKAQKELRQAQMDMSYAHQHFNEAERALANSKGTRGSYASNSNDYNNQSDENSNYSNSANSNYDNNSGDNTNY